MGNARRKLRLAMVGGGPARTSATRTAAPPARRALHPPGGRICLRSARSSAFAESLEMPRPPLAGAGRQRPSARGTEGRRRVVAHHDAERAPPIAKAFSSAASTSSATAAHHRSTTRSISALARPRRLVFAVTYNSPGYRWWRQAARMISVPGESAPSGLVQVEHASAGPDAAGASGPAGYLRTNPSTRGSPPWSGTSARTSITSRACTGSR